MRRPTAPQPDFPLWAVVPPPKRGLGEVAGPDGRGGKAGPGSATTGFRPRVLQRVPGWPSEQPSLGTAGIT